MIKGSKQGLMIVIISILAMIFAASSFGGPYYIVRESGVGETTYYSHFALFESSNYPYADMILSYNPHSLDATGLMNTESVLATLMLLLTLGFITAVLSDRRLFGVLEGAAAVLIGVIGLVYFAVRIPRIADVDSFIGSGIDGEGHEYVSKPMESWIYLLIATLLMSIAVGIRAFVVSKGLEPEEESAPEVES